VNAARAIIVQLMYNKIIRKEAIGASRLDNQGVANYEA